MVFSIGIISAKSSLSHIQSSLRELGGGMILRNYANSTEILTSNSTLRRLTRNSSRSQLTDYLRQNCATAFSLGWGVGLNVLQAQQNANRAINESLRDPSHGTYLIDESDQLTGPLGAEGCRTFSTQSSQEAPSCWPSGSGYPSPTPSVCWRSAAIS